jgi:hypothetical protein
MMGLDMYLSKKIYVRPDDRDEVKIAGAKTPVWEQKVKEIVEEVGYWRKANAIHCWFVEHVQQGQDDCGEYDVSETQLRELLDTVNTVLDASELVEGQVITEYRSKPGCGWEPIIEQGKVIKDPTMAERLLPTQEGFFFGSTDYDQYYYDDLVLTKHILEDALASGGDYYYSSSW